MIKILNLIVFLIVFLPIFSGCVPRQYSPEDLQHLNAKKENGVVIQQSRGSFALITSTGEETTYRTGELTQYIPENYRSQEGDRVQVTYQEIWERSGRIKYAVLQLGAISVPDENKALANPLSGIIVSVNRGSAQYAKTILLKLPNREEALPLYVSPNTDLIIDGNIIPTENYNFAGLIDRNARIISSRKPIFRGNAYIYVIDKLEIP